MTASIACGFVRREMSPAGSFHVADTQSLSLTQKGHDGADWLRRFLAGETHQYIFDKRFAPEYAARDGATVLPARNTGHHAADYQTGVSTRAKKSL